MGNIVEKLINLRKILLENGQREAAKKVENVMKNIGDKENVYSLKLAMHVRDFGDLYIHMSQGEWWKILCETREDIRELYFLLESTEQGIEGQYIDMVNELFNIAKENKDEKLINRLEKILNDYNSPKMIRDLLKISGSQGGRPVEYYSKEYGNWGSLLRELDNKANAYLRKMENAPDKVEEYIQHLKKQFTEYFSKEIEERD